MKDWEKLYKKKGEVQSDVMPFIRKAAEVFEEKKVKRILDLGCGTGRHTIFLASLGFDVYGIDISESGLEITREKLKESGLKATVMKGDMYSLGFEDGFFDAVISTYVINHSSIEQFRRIVKELERVTRRDGLLVLAVLSDKDGWFGKGKKIEENTFLPTFFPDEANVPHHFFSEEELRKELGMFKILELHHFTSWSKRRNTNWAALEVICQYMGP